MFIFIFLICLSDIISLRFDEAWKTCQMLNNKESWIQLGEAALRNIEVDFGRFI